MSACTLYVRLCDLIVQSQCTQRQHSYNNIIQRQQSDNGIIKHSVVPIAHAQLHPVNNTSSHHTKQSATSTPASSHVTRSSHQPSTLHDTSTSNHTDMNNQSINNNLYQFDDNGKMAKSNEQQISQDMSQQSQFDVNGLYVILRYGKEVHRSSQLANEDETTATTNTKTSMITTIIASWEQEERAKCIKQVARQQQQQTSLPNMQQYKNSSVQEGNKDLVYCSEVQHEVQKYSSTINNKVEHLTKTKRRRSTMRRVFEWNELFVFTACAPQNARSTPLALNALQKIANTNEPNNINNLNSWNNTYNNNNNYIKPCNINHSQVVNLPLSAQYIQHMSTNVFTQRQKQQPCQQRGKQSENSKFCVWPHELLEQIVIELWVDAANEALCIARGRLHLNSLYEQYYCNDKSIYNIHNDGSNVTLTRQSNSLSSQTVLPTHVQDKATATRKRRHSQLHSDNNFINNYQQNGKNDEKGKVNRQANTTLSQSASSPAAMSLYGVSHQRSTFHSSGDDDVIEIVVPLLSNVPFALFVKLRIQCVGLHRLLHDLHCKWMQQKNKAITQQCAQPSSLLTLPEEITTKGIIPFSSTTFTNNDDNISNNVNSNYIYVSTNNNNNHINTSVNNNNNSGAVTSTLVPPSFLTGIQGVAPDYTNYYSYNSNYVYNTINGITVNSNINVNTTSAPILTPSPPLLVSPMPQPPIMHNNTPVLPVISTHHHQQHYCYPPSSLSPSSSSSLTSALPLRQSVWSPAPFQHQQQQHQQQQQQLPFTWTQQMQPHNALYEPVISNNSHYTISNNMNTNCYNQQNDFTRSFNDVDRSNITNNYVIPSQSATSLSSQQAMPFTTPYSSSSNNNNLYHPVQYTTNVHDVNNININTSGNTHVASLPSHVSGMTYVPQQQPISISQPQHHDYPSVNNNTISNSHQQNIHFAPMRNVHYTKNVRPYMQQQQQQHTKQQHQHQPKQQQQN